MVPSGETTPAVDPYYYIQTRSRPAFQSERMHQKAKPSRGGAFRPDGAFSASWVGAPILRISWKRKHAGP